MIFLIEYNRREARTVRMQEYPDSCKLEAEDARLKIELELNLNGTKHDVVLLEADSKGALRRTHRRYFGPLDPVPKSRGDLAEPNAGEQLGNF